MNAESRFLESSQVPDPLFCTHCDEGYVERDRSMDDCTTAVREKCDECNGTKLVCVECAEPATLIDFDGAPVCKEHRTATPV